MFSRKHAPTVSNQGFFARIDDPQGGSMGKHKDENEKAPVVGASGSVGILPDGYFAKILSDSSQESSSKDSQSSQDASQHC
jgi:hypothetical protein